MKKIFSLTIVVAILTSMFSMFSIASAETSVTPEVYTPTEFVKNDFDTSSELSEFTLSNTASDWSVADGKLVYAASDTSVHTIEKAVNIPSVQSFVMELSTEYLYRYSDMIISFNDAQALKLTASGSSQALDAKWKIFFDRQNGIRVFWNDVEITTSGNPKISASSMTGEAISKITISFKGSSDRSDPAFDYLYVYGYGDIASFESNYSDYNGSDYIVDRYNTRHDLVITDGKVQPLSSEQYTLTKDVVIGNTEDIIIDFGISNSDKYKKLRVMINGASIYEYNPNSSYQTGKYRIVINRDTASGTVFKDGSQISSLENLTLPENITTAGVFVFGTSSMFDYFNVYTQGISASVSDVTSEGLKVYANSPLDLTNSAFTVNGETCEVIKSNEGKFVYDVVFAGELEGGNDYTLSANMASLFGEEKTAELAFSLPAETYAEPSKYFGSDFTAESDVNHFGYIGVDGTDVTSSVAGGALKVAANVGGDKYPSITKDGFTVPANKNFVLDFEMSGMYRYATTTIKLNDTDVYFVKANNGKKDGKYRLIVDRVNGMKLYKDGQLIPLAKSDNTTYAEEKSGATDLLGTDITSFTLKIQLNDNTQSIDYINAYAVQKSFMYEVDGEFTKKNVIIKTTEPLDLQHTTANVGDISAVITEIEYCKYDIQFAESVSTNTLNTLTVNAITLFGKSAMMNFGFKVQGSPYRYIDNNFELTEELAGFVCETPFTVSEGKLVGQAAANTVVQSISKAVNIPSDMGFVLELNPANLYRYSDLEIKLNDATALTLNADGATQALDGKWKIIFDRIDGISAYMNGVLIGSEGNPRIKGTPDFTMSDVSNIKLSFRGTDNVAPEFEYIYAYSLGENEKYVSNYNDEADLDNEIFWYDYEYDQIDKEILEGNLVLTNITTGEKQPILKKEISSDISKDVIIEFSYSQPENYKRYNVLLNGSTIVQYQPMNASGNFKIILDRKTKVCSLYKDGVLQDSTYIKKAVPDEEITSISISPIISAGKSVSLDYFNVYYAKDVEVELVSSDVSGFTITTTEPIDIETISVKNGEETVEVTATEEDICTYKISANPQLSYTKEYTFAVEAKTLRGADVLDTVTFITPEFTEISSNYSDDFSYDKNDKRFNDDGGKGTMTVKDGNLSIKSNGNGYPQYFTGYFNVDKTQVVLESRVKIPYGTKYSSTGFKLEIDGTRYELTGDIKGIYEWTVFDVVLDFDTHKAKLYADGVYVSEKEFATDKTAQQIMASTLSVNQYFFLTSKEALVDYISVFDASPEFDITVKEKSGRKITLQSTNPISAETLKTASFDIDGVNVLNVKAIAPCIYELALDSEINTEKIAVLEIKGLKDLLGNTLDKEINVGGNIAINSIEEDAVLGKVRFTVNYTNNDNTDKNVVLVVNLRRKNGSYYKSKFITLTLKAETENGTITTEYIDNPFEFNEEYFILDGLNTMNRIY